MDKRTKKWLIAAACLVGIGLIVMGGVMTMLNWNFRKLSTVKYETNTHRIYNTFTDISLSTNTADITFAPSSDGSCKVVCHEETNLKHAVTAEDGALKIYMQDTRKWYSYIGIHFGSPKITVYLPAGEYGALTIQTGTSDTKIAKDFKFQSMDVSQSTGDVVNYASAGDSIKIKTTTGKITMQGVSAKSVYLSASTGKITASDIGCEGEINAEVSTGKIYLTNVNCKNLSSGGSTGDIDLEDVIAEEKITIKRSTGDVEFERCDAAEISVETDTGDVEGSFLSDKVFIVKTSTGDVDVPSTVTGGKCAITTSTGDIEISIK